MEPIGAYICKDLVGELSITDEEDEAADKVVGGETAGGGGGEAGLLVPEAGGVGDEADGAAEDGEDQKWTWDEASLAEVGDLLEEEQEREESDQVRDQRWKRVESRDHCGHCAILLLLLPCF